MAESMLRLWRAMEPLTMFTNAEVLEDALPHPWLRLHHPRHWNPQIPQPLGSKATAGTEGLAPGVCFVVTCSMGHLKSTATAWAASSSLVPTQWAESPWEEGSSQQLAPPLGFVKIMRSLWVDNPLEVMGIPPELAEEQGPIQVVGSAMFSDRLVQDMISGSTYIDVITCSMSLVGLGVTPLVGDHSMPTFLGEEDKDSD